MKVWKIFCALGLALVALLPQGVMGGANDDKQDDNLMNQQYSHSIAFSPDGQQVVVGYESKVMKLWELSSGKMTRDFKGHSEAVVAVGFSPDGKSILSGSVDKTVKLWDASSGKVIRTFTGHAGDVVSIAFSKDGRHALSGSMDHTMKLWEIESGKELRSYQGHGGYSGSVVAFSPDEKSVLMGNTLWDKETGSEIRRFKESGSNGYWKDSARFSTDGKYLWLGETLLEVATGKPLVVLTGIFGRVLHQIFAYSPDGKYVISGGGGNYGTSSIFDVSNYNSPDPTVDRIMHVRPVSDFQSEKWPITAIAISPDSKNILVRTLYVADRDPDTLTLFDISNTDKPIRSFKAR